MKYLLLLVMFIPTASLFASQTPQGILRNEGFVLVTKQLGKEIYYRPKEVKVSDNIAYYSNTVFYTSNIDGQTKYSLKTEYKALACKERKYIVLGVHTVPYVGVANYKDNTKNGIKANAFKSLNTLELKMFSKVCK